MFPRRLGTFTVAWRAWCQPIMTRMPATFLATECYHWVSSIAKGKASTNKSLDLCMSRDPRNQKLTQYFPIWCPFFIFSSVQAKRWRLTSPAFPGVTLLIHRTRGICKRWITASDSVSSYEPVSRDLLQDKNRTHWRHHRFHCLNLLCRHCHSVSLHLQRDREAWGRRTIRCSPSDVFSALKIFLGRPGSPLLTPLEAGGGESHF